MVPEGALAVNQSFFDLLQKTIEDVLSRLFPREQARAMLEYVVLETLMKEENPEIFADALRKVLGINFVPVTIVILSNLYSRFGLKFEEKEGYGFSDYVSELKEAFEERK